MKRIFLVLLFFWSTRSLATTNINIITSVITANSKIVLIIDTPLYCNQPEVKLTYLYSERSDFGPHYYRVEITPINRMLCSGSREIKVLLDPPKFRSAGDLLIIGIDDEAPLWLVL